MAIQGKNKRVYLIQHTDIEYNKFLKRLGRRVRRIRIGQKFSQGELARLVGITTSNYGQTVGIANLEMGVPLTYSMYAIFKMSQLFGVPIRELFNFQNTQNWQGLKWDNNFEVLYAILSRRTPKDVAYVTEIVKRLFIYGKNGMGSVGSWNENVRKKKARTRKQVRHA